MTTPPRPQRSHARTNRGRILAAAREELGRDPDATLDEIARAAAVVRRTVYGHFPNRHALIDALTEEAQQVLTQAFTSARHPDTDPVTALARLNVAGWTVSDRYRMLITLGRRDPGNEEVRAALTPARAAAVRILERGQRESSFADHVPALALAQALEALNLALYEVQDPQWNERTSAAATATLLAAGVPAATARAHIEAVIAEVTTS